MSPKKGEIVELRIEKVAYGGEGIGRLHGLVFFVRGGIPGDRVLAKVVRKKRTYAQARVTEILEASPDRITPPCPYSGYCGGCQWQNARYEAQLKYKKVLVEDSLSGIPSLRDTPIHGVIASPKQFGYRNKMEFSFSDRRWFLPGELPWENNQKHFALGLHIPGTFHKVLDVNSCLLQNEKGNELLREIKNYAKNSGIPAYGLKTHQGFWRFLALRHGAHSDEWMVNIITSELKLDILNPLAEVLSNRFPEVKTIVNNINSRKASIAVGEKEIVLVGQGTISDRIGPFFFQISANSFFQTNSPAAQKLYGKVADYAELNGAELVLDLYSGTGTIPVFLSGVAQGIIGMEIMADAVRDAEINCRKNCITNCRFVLGDIKDNLKNLKVKPDVLIIDPPRAGMHKDVLSGVMELGAEKVVYVSCHPMTMARDLAKMSEDYRVLEVQPVDMFPHTYHVEAVAKLRRKK
ncbi:MAG: 23S rRNA (uracil(1939)-C(5))-methyltransferase RlmD [Deltaproteobacteria bacterium]|nr:23S rRNA (uracil(1939)-C(5))-methyltransferase RlmD [Deltaproteobacteria bacterium]